MAIQSDIVGDLSVTLEVVREAVDIVKYDDGREGRLRVVGQRQRRRGSDPARQEQSRQWQLLVTAAGSR